MISRNKIKTLLYQRLYQNVQLQDWYSSHYSAGSLQPYIFEAGQRIPSEEIPFPAIRYKLLPPLWPVSSCENCTEDIYFDIYIESRKENTNESDELMDIIRDIFFERCGRGTGIFSQENEAYLELTSGNGGIETWDAEEVYQDQFTSDPAQGQALNRAVAGIHADGFTIIGILRFKITIANG